jgi:dTDP-glucose pyrophosphorylase/CBS domain-containing protein
MLGKIGDFFVKPHDAIRTAIECIDRNQQGIALVVDEERKLVGTITDGDIRRAILATINLDSSVQVILDRKLSSLYPKPVTALIGTDPTGLLNIMRSRALRQIPLLDQDGRVVDLVLLTDLIPAQKTVMQAVIMAGGLGTRLRPLTESLPKPMLPVGGRPIMEMIIEQLREAGIHKVNVTTHFKPEKIMDHFGDGSAFGVELKYLNEQQPLGTGGALGLMPAPHEPVLVINGDIVTQVDFRVMLNYHQEHKADMTVAVRQYDMKVPYGVVECAGARVSRLQEKPELTFFVNAGIYLLEPSVYAFIQNGERFNMTDLIQKLLDSDRNVVSFPILEYWLDVGQHENYQQVQEDQKNGRF